MIGLQEEWIQKRICPRYFNRGVCVRAGKDSMARKFKALRPTLAGRYWLLLIHVGGIAGIRYRH